MTETSERKATAPYTPFPTFKNFIQGLREHPLPQQIDKSLMSNLSGGDQSRLFGCLRFLRLITEQGALTAQLKSLVNAKGDDWATILKAVITEGYKALGTLDLTTMTTKQLEDLFRECYDSTGDTLFKSMRFYLKAVEEAKIPVSTRLVVRSAPAGTRRLRKDKTEKGNDAEEQDGEEGEDAISHTLRLPNNRSGELRIPARLTHADIERIWKQLDALKALVQAQAAAVEDEGDEEVTDG